MRRAEQTPATGGRLLLVLAGVVVLAVLALGGIAAHSDPWAEAPQPTAPTDSPLPTASPAYTTPASDQAAPTPADALSTATAELTTEVVLVVVTVLCLGALGLLVGVLHRPRWRRGHGDPGATHELTAGPGRPDEQLSAAVGQALDLVEDRPDAREAVVRAWLLLGAAAAAAGTPARPAETSAEYAARLAEERRLPPEAVQRLAELYREARFSGHEVRPDQRDEARTQLLALRAALPAQPGAAVPR